MTCLAKHTTRVCPHHTPCASHTSLPCPWMQIHHNPSRCATTHAQFVRCEPRFDSAHCIISEMTKIIQCTAGSWRWIESKLTSLSTQINPEHKLGNSLHFYQLYLNITECPLFSSLYNVCAVVHCAHFKDVFLDKQLVSDRKKHLLLSTRALYSRPKWYWKGKELTLSKSKFGESMKTLQPQNQQIMTANQICHRTQNLST